MSKNKTLLSYFNKRSSIKNNLTPESPQHEKLNSEKLKSPKFSTPGKRSVSESKISSPDDIEENKINYNGSAVSSARSKRRRIVIASDSESSSDEYKPGKDSSDSESSEGSNVSEAELELTPVKKSVKNSTKIENKSSTFSSKKSPVTISKNTKSKLAAFSPAEKFKSEITVETESKEWSHLKLDWLKDGQRKDKKGRPMSHPDYDPRTLYVPENFRKCLTPAMKQWWEMKAEHFDTVLFFKVGKFYELYHMDAVTAVNELGLVYMKGEFAHSGFPEIAYCRYSEGLIQKGYKVARVEQTETPQMMEERCKGIPKPTRFDKVVMREICQITTKGTRTFSFQDGEVISANASYLLAVTERIPGNSSFGESEYGVCFIDTSIGKFYMGQFIDDRHCSRVRTMIVHYPPVEVLYEKDAISKKTHQTLNCTLGSCRKEALFKGTQFWETSKVLKFLINGKYFSDKDKKGNDDACEWPETIKEMLDNDDRLQQTAKKNCELAIRALGACIWYLKECCIEDQMLTMKNFEHYIPLDGNELKYSKVKKSFSGQQMILDGVTLQNLEILESNTSEMFGGSLQEAMDFCCTNFGKRLFRQWLCSPLCNPQSIADRLDAVEDLQKISHITTEPIKLLKKMPDLEKLLSRIHTQGLARSKDHPDTRAIFYQEDTYTKKKIIDFLSALEGFRSAIKIVSHFKSCVKDFRSSILSKCVRLESDGGHFPDLQDAIDFFDNAFDHEKAKKEGQIKPAKGVDDEYDIAVKDLTEAQKELDFYLEKQRKHFQCKVTYHGTGRNRFQLEIPEHATKHATNKYELQSQKKGFKRYWTAEIKELLACVVAAEDQRDSALHDIMRKIFETFDKKYALWKAAVQCLSVLDVLLCFLQYSQSCQVTMCRPEIIQAEDESEVILEIHGGRHPSLLRSFTGDSYIPNDVCLGSFQHSGKEMKNGGNIVLVTGPNMGGKSTLMRQTGLLIIMAQMGSYIPAEKCCLTPVDRIFTRLGASDRITAGESTFFVEISETASILQHATQDSLVLVDELGRGTATYDGTAIACAVIRELANKINCRTLFSTHYHCLVEEFSSNSKVALGHMACIVEDDDKHPALESITFLYKFMEGVCPKSYGFNVAHLAGIPDEVIQNSYHKAQEFESSVESQKVFGLLNLCKSRKDLQYIQSINSEINSEIVQFTC